MGITTAMCTSFKSEVLGGVHDLDTHTLKLALIKSGESGTYGAATANYSDVTGNSDEASGTNYSAGGQNLDSAAISVDGTTAIVDFADLSYLTATITAMGALIYNTSQANKSVAVLDFVSNKVSIVRKDNDDDNLYLKIIHWFSNNTR